MSLSQPPRITRSKSKQQEDGDYEPPQGFIKATSQQAPISRPRRAVKFRNFDKSPATENTVGKVNLEQSPDFHGFPPLPQPARPFPRPLLRSQGLACSGFLPCKWISLRLTQKRVGSPLRRQFPEPTLCRRSPGYPSSGGLVARYP